jgi:hypothetical protein
MIEKTGHIEMKEATELLASYTAARVSEETSPISCKRGYAMRGLKCTGDYYDAMFMTCCPNSSGSDNHLTYKIKFCIL